MAGNDIWAQALAEAENPQARDAGLWARCFAEAGGDEGRAKAAYMNKRVEQESTKTILVDEHIGRCPSCGAQCNINLAKCPKCGVVFGDDWKPEFSHVAQVEQANPAATHWRPTQPEPQAPGVQLVKTQRSRGIYIILALFFGLLGIHNFYAGRYARGVIQMLITVILGWFVIGLVISGIWAIVDCFTVTTDGGGHPMG